MLRLLFRLPLHEKNDQTDDGRRKRYRGANKPLRETLETIKVFVFSPFIWVILFLAVVLIVSVVLTLHWDRY